MAAGPSSLDVELDRATFLAGIDPVAYGVLDQRMMQWLLTTDERLSFEAGAVGVLVSAPLLPPDQMPMLIATAAAFAGHIPRVAGLP